MICFVVNKKSGNGRARKVWAHVELLLQQSDVDYCAIFSEDASQAQQKIRELAMASAEAAKPSRIIVIGGDGTIHGLLPIAIELSLPLGIVPAGSGNDFARGLNIPFDPAQALHIALHQPARPSDYIETSGKCAMTVVGIGLDAEVAYAVNHTRWKKWFNRLRLGFLIYVYCLLSTLFTYRPTDVLLIVDGQEYHFTKVWLMATANLPYFGGGMKISPHSTNDDHVLDICVVHSMSAFGLIKAFPKVYKGRHLSDPRVTFLRGTQVEATAGRMLRSQGDGESLGQTPITISLQSNRLHVIANDPPRVQ